MPNPKRQHSKQRTRKRRTHYKASVPSLGPCPHCHKAIVSHRVCPFCGYYKGKPIVVIETKESNKTRISKKKGINTWGEYNAP